MSNRRVLIAAALLLTIVFAACSDDDTTGPGNVVQTVDSPTFAPPAGNYSSTQAVTISCSTTDADVYYTLDGSDPTESSTLYDPLSMGITIAETTTVKARAYKDGMNASDIVTALYTIDLNDVATPVFNPLPGSYNDVQNVAINCATAGSSIYYTLDGSDPDESSSPYISPNTIRVAATTTIKARAYAAGMDPSAIATADYIIDLPDVAEPQINPRGGIYPSGRTVTITCATPSSDIHYTTDGSEPDQRSPLYTRSFMVSSTTTVRARAYAADMDPSPIAAETLVIIEGLVAYYPFNGNANDASGNTHHGSVFGPVLAYDRHGMGRAAYQFDGIDDYIELPDEASFDFTEYTISVWVRVDTLPIVPAPMQPGKYTTINKGSNLGNYTLYVAKYGGASYCNLSYAHRVSVGTWSMGCYDGNLYRFNWYNVTITMDTEINIYVDGVLQCTSSGMTAALQNDDNVLIGKLRTGVDELPFKGFIDDVRFYNRALSSTEIQQLYNAEN
jgi:hypothetical protein